jgi:RNA recognition motif-containing protein
VRDVRIIRDQRSGRSKGVAYVEFYAPESVLRAMTLTGTKFLGQEIVVQASQAEKNRQAVVAKYKKDMQDQLNPPENTETPMRIAIEGLAEFQANLTENDFYKVCNGPATALTSFSRRLAPSSTSTYRKRTKRSPTSSSSARRTPKKPSRT